MIKTILIIVLLSTSIAAKLLTLEYFDSTKKIWIKGTSVYAKQGEHLSLRVAIKPELIKEVRWYQIIPDISRYYKNANHPHEPNPYKWVGFGKITYNRIHIPSFNDSTTVTITPALLNSTAPKNTPLYHTNLGSFWFQVEVTLKNGKKLRSAGTTENDHRGLSPKVFRLSYLLDYSYMGYVTSFLNVPGIFGSVPYQCQNYIGADCADVLMAARAIYKKLPMKDYNVAMLVRTFSHRSKATIYWGNPDKELKWGSDIQVGDFIAVRYSPKSQFAHIGVLYKDANSNGFLDKEDIVLHAGPEALHGSRLADRGFDGEVVFLKHL